jgi:hypothetical protein
MIVTAICVHVLAGVFWAGSTMTLAMVGYDSRGIHAAQLIAGALVVSAGTYLWHVLHAGNFSDTERMLTVGAVSAVVALVLQCAFTVPEWFGGLGGRSLLGVTSLSAQRIAAVLLAVAALAMAASKYI